MTQAEIADLRAENVRIYRRMVDLNESAGTDSFGAEEQAKWDRLNDAYERNRKRILDAPTRQAVARHQTAAYPGDGLAGDLDRNGIRSDPEYARAFDQYLRRGLGDMDAENKAVLRDGFGRDVETRTQTVGTNTAGGFAVPDAPMAVLQENMLAFGGLLAGPINFIETQDGRDWPIPESDDTSNSAVILAENTGAATADATFSVTTLGAFKFSSKFIKISGELLMDASFDVPSWAARTAGERIGRGLSPYLVTGTGSGEPAGLDTAASFTTAASISAITRQDILDLIHTVDASYRQSDAFRLVMSDSTLKAVRELSIGSSDDRPLWVPSMREGQPDTIEGVPYIVDHGCADIGAGNHSMYAGDLSKFWVRQGGPVRFKRLDERFADSDVVAFISFVRYDSAIIDAGTSPIAYLRHEAS